jgi:hypothetical protein
LASNANLGLILPLSYQPTSFFAIGLPIVVLLISLITLFAGPLILIWLSRGGRIAQAFDRVIVIALILLVVVLLLPEIIESLGWAAVALLAVGYFLPGVLEAVVRQAAEKLHIASLLIALLGLLLHALLDGAGLAGSEMANSESLGVAIIMHRFGVGMMIWLIMQPTFGHRSAWVMLIGMAAATIVGFEFSARLMPLAGKDAFDILQAVIIGTIIHSLVHRGHVHSHHHHRKDDPTDQP